MYFTVFKIIEKLLSTNSETKTAAKAAVVLSIYD